MRVEGRVFRSGKYWAIEIPILDLYTQGRSRKDAFAMLQEAARLLVDDDGFELEVYAGTGERFEAAGKDAAAFFAFVLRRQRQARGLTLKDVSKRLGLKSRNAYARYEQGRTVPTIEKFTELLKAVNPDVELVVRTG